MPENTEISEENPSEIVNEETNITQLPDESESEWQKIQQLMTEQHQELMQALAQQQTETPPEMEVVEAEVLSSSNPMENLAKNDAEDEPKNKSRKTTRMERKAHRKAPASAKK